MICEVPHLRITPFDAKPIEKRGRKVEISLDIENIELLRSEGWTLRQIGESYGCTLWNTYYHLRKAAAKDRQATERKVHE